MILHDLFDWSNAGVGGVGLLLTIAAIVQATGAKRAAREARQRCLDELALNVEDFFRGGSRGRVV